jgi:hypothetical protein
MSQRRHAPYLRPEFWCSLVVLATLCLLPPLALAQTASSIAASITPPTLAKLDIKAEPLSLLAMFPQGGPKMAQALAKAIRSEPSLIDRVLAIADDTSPEQASAMGAGLVRAVRALSTRQPAAAGSIIKKVLASTNLRLKTTFFANGPRNLMRSTLILPPPIQPSTTIVEGSLGTPLANSKLGVGKPSSAPTVAPLEIDGMNQITRNGMILAAIGSDEQTNQVVSTSPIN